MPEYSAQIPYLAAPILALLFVSWSHRWRWAGALGVGLMALGLGAWKGVLLPSDVGTLLTHGGLSEGIAQLFMWTVYAMLLRAHGRIPIKGHPMLVAPVMGALLGELAAAALLSSSARDSPSAARLALAAAGGAMIGRVGDPAIMVMWSDQISPIFLGLAGLGCVAIASPEADDFEAVESESVDPLFLGGCISVACLAAMRLLAIEGLAVGCGLMLYLLRGRVRTVDLRPLAWLTGSTLVVLVATAGGVMALGGQGLEELWGIMGDRTRMILAAGSALLSALCGGQAATLVTEGLLLRSQGMQIEHLHTAMAAGLAVGGLGPLVIAGGLKHGLLKWMAQVALVLVLCALFLG